MSIPSLRRLALLVTVAACVAAATAALPRSAERGRVALRELVAPTDALAAHDLGFDARFAAEATAGLRTHDPALVERLAGLPAVEHILAHARNFDYDVPKQSPRSLVEALLAPPGTEASRVAACAEATAYFAGPMLADPHWVADTLAYLPAGYRFHGTLFLTFGYDIGVAFDRNASLNCTHPHFGRPRELLYYAIHELHHVGFMAYHAPPRIAGVKTCADLRALVEYSTQLEGMAVLAAYHRRRDEGALTDDGDYVALGDERRMGADVASYFADYDDLKGRGTQPADAAAWAVVERMSSGERLWYRVGAHMARRIEALDGRGALVDLIAQGPARFVARGRASLPSAPGR